MLVIDRFEGDWSVIKFGDKTFNLPKELLPAGTREGDIIKISVTVDRDETKKRQEKIQTLLDELFD